MTDELIPWLHRQIDAAEASTRALLYWAQQTILTLQDPKLLGKHIPGWHDWPNVERMCQQRLAEIDAMRLILAAHPLEGPSKYVPFQYCGTCQDLDGIVSGPAPCPTLRALALPYDSHPDYDESWRP